MKKNTERKQTFEQAMAAERNFAKGRAMRRDATRRREALAQDQANAPVHEHFWSDWSMDPVEPLEHRKCRCGATETREFRGL